MIRRTMAALVLMLLALGPGGAAGARAAPGDDAWAALRTRVPPGTSLYRPTWLPKRFQAAPRYTPAGPIVGVAYRSGAGDTLLFVVGGANTCPTTTVPVEEVLIQGVVGQERPEEAHRRELEGAPQPVVLAAPCGQQQLIGVVEMAVACELGGCRFADVAAVPLGLFVGQQGDRHRRPPPTMRPLPTAARVRASISAKWY